MRGVNDTEARKGTVMEALSFKDMVEVVQRAFDALPEHRRGKNVQYEIGDAAVAAILNLTYESSSQR